MRSQERRHSSPQLSSQPVADQRPCLVNPVKRNEAAEAWALGLAQQHFIQRLEPGAQIVEFVPLADFVDFVLDGAGIGGAALGDSFSVI